jgi:hypothetical protein
MFSMATGAVETGATDDSMPEGAGISQRRHSRINSINTRTRFDPPAVCCLPAGIPYRCFVGVGLAWMERLPPCTFARGLQIQRPSGIDLAALPAVL